MRDRRVTAVVVALLTAVSVALVATPLPAQAADLGGRV
jgi:hypothetical protein